MARQPDYNRKILPINVYGSITEKQMLFCYLHCLIGYSAAQSYKTAFGSKASLNSCSAMASRLLHDEGVRDFIVRLIKYHEAGSLDVNAKAEKYQRSIFI